MNYGVAVDDKIPAAPSQEKSIQLPQPFELVASSLTPACDRYVVDLELDHASLARRKKGMAAKSFCSVLPGQSMAINPWSLQIFVNTVSITVQLWRDTSGVTSVSVLAVSLRLFSSTNSSSWNLVEKTLTAGEKLADKQKGYETCSFTISASKLKEENAEALWSKRYRLETVIVHSLDTKLPEIEQSAALTAERQALAAFSLSHSPNDLRLVFPASPAANAELWTSASLLKSLSPYHKVLLDSDFSEAVTFLDGRGDTERANLAEPREAGVPAAPSESAREEGNDLDDEIDEVASSSNHRVSPPRPADPVRYRQVTIKDAAWSTYFALLTYAMTGHLFFAPLRSSRTSAEDTSAYKSSLEAHFEHTPCLPPPVSPKSLYQLAHLLENDQLCILSLREFRRQLTPPIAVIELFSTIAAKYDDLRSLALNYVVKSWAQVKDSDELKKVKERIMARCRMLRRYWWS